MGEQVDGLLGLVKEYTVGSIIYGIILWSAVADNIR